MCDRLMLAPATRSAAMSSGTIPQAEWILKNRNVVSELLLTGVFDRDVVPESLAWQLLRDDVAVAQGVEQRRRPGVVVARGVLGRWAPAYPASALALT